MNLGPWVPIIGGLMTIAMQFAAVEWAVRLMRNIAQPDGSNGDL